jgi:hypothetical protein
MVNESIPRMSHIPPSPLSVAFGPSEHVFIAIRI